MNLTLVPSSPRPIDSDCEKDDEKEDLKPSDFDVDNVPKDVIETVKVQEDNRIAMAEQVQHMLSVVYVTHAVNTPYITHPVMFITHSVDVPCVTHFHTFLSPPFSPESP